MTKSLERKGDKTRRLVIETALDLFHREGFHQVSLPRLAGEVGITHAGIYRHFADREDLLLSCCEHSLASAAAVFSARVVNDRLPARARLREYVQSNFDWGRNYPRDFSSLVVMHYFGLHHPKLKALHHRVNETSIARIETILCQGVNEGQWSPPKTSACARMIHSLMVGEMIKRFNWPREKLDDATFFAGLDALTGPGP
jgi:AcrR family transcriptional regulator